jgi:hypothetical protein
MELTTLATVAGEAVDPESGADAKALMEDGYLPSEQAGFIASQDALREVPLALWEQMRGLL